MTDSDLGMSIKAYRTSAQNFKLDFIGAGLKAVQQNLCQK